MTPFERVEEALGWDEMAKRGFHPVQTLRFEGHTAPIEMLVFLPSLMIVQALRAKILLCFDHSVGFFEQLGGELERIHLARPGLRDFDPHEHRRARRGDFPAAARKAVAEHVAAALPDGSVLVAGGYSGTGIIATAERYNPVTQGWTSVAPMASKRGGGAGVGLASGHVLAISGWEGGGHVAGAERYVPALQTWVPTGALSEGRELSTATTLPNGEVLVAGGT